MEGFEKAEERIAQEIGKISGLGLRTCDCYTIAKAVMRIELFSFSDNLRNAGVIARLEATEKDKENLERTLEEINETLRANGISIDCNGVVHYAEEQELSSAEVNKERKGKHYLEISNGPLLLESIDVEGIEEANELIKKFSYISPELSILLNSINETGNGFAVEKEVVRLGTSNYGLGKISKNEEE